MISEIFPLRIRGLGVGLSVLVQWLTNTLITFSFPVLLGLVGLGPVFMAFAVLNVIALWLAARNLPETSNRSLEEIETLMETRRARSAKPKDYLSWTRGERARPHLDRPAIEAC
ncbi:MAG: MFS transporter [Pirellulales bacterium]